MFNTELGERGGEGDFIMKKIVFLLFLMSISFHGFSQIVYTPSIPNRSGSFYQNNQDDPGETYRTTGYILNSSGQIVKKIQIRVSVNSSPFGEIVKIVAYYRVIEGLGAYWERVSISANTVKGQIPVFDEDKVGYNNFMYWANWGASKIWFN